ncbi:hypothetical protein SAMN03159390_00589 [Pseudomonas sp. NFACC49-2]|nr:hypothetical protein SAMN03159390_00589 [Pseudomonas sp. NFACC49-2]
MPWAMGAAKLGGLVSHVVKKENCRNKPSVDEHKSTDVDRDIRLIFKPEFFKSGTCKFFEITTQIAELNRTHGFLPDPAPCRAINQ